MKYYSTLNKNELSNHEKTWKNLKGILLSERSNLKKLHTMILTIRRSAKRDSKKTSSKKNKKILKILKKKKRKRN